MEAAVTVCIEYLCRIDRKIGAGDEGESERLKIDLTCGNYDSKREACMFGSGFGRA